MTDKILFPKLFSRIGKSPNANLKAECFESLKPIKQKGTEILSAFRKKHREITRLIAEGCVVKSQQCSLKSFVSPLVFTVKENENMKLP